MPSAPGPVQTHPWHHRRHHGTPGGFRNPEEDGAGAGHAAPLKVARWLTTYLLQKKQNVPPPVHRTNLAALHDAPRSGLRITWIGHSATLIQTPTLTLLTDPVFSRRASPVPFAGPARRPALPFGVADLPPVDVVLLSHDHYDHLDRASALKLRERFDPAFVVPLGVAAVLRRWGLDAAAEMDWWQYVDLEAAEARHLRIHCTPARHFSGRTLLGRDGTLWASYFLELPDAPLLFYAGDSAYGAHFAEVQRWLGAPEVALLPIGAYRPRWFMRPVHMDPPEALQAFADLGARHFVPIHWGTFDLSEEPIQEPPRMLLQEARRRVPDAQRRLHVLDIGQSLELPAQDARRQ